MEVMTSLGGNMTTMRRFLLSALRKRFATKKTSRFLPAMDAGQTSFC
jgi:hypothetical protein